MVEDLTFLAEHSVGASEAARRVGLGNRGNLDRFLRRHGHVQLLNRLTRQDYWPTTGAGTTRRAS